MECPNCGKEMKLIPKGISKSSGKPYNAFYSCKECGETFNLTEEPGFKKEVRESPLPIPKGNGNNLDMMRLAYRKDLMNQVLETYSAGGTANISTMVQIFEQLWKVIEA